MIDFKPIHFGIYSNKAFELIRKYAGDGIYFHGAYFKQANDNEIIFYNYETQMIYTSESIRNIVIDRLEKRSLNCNDEAEDIVKLVRILKNSENLTEDEKKLIGKPLNPFKSEAIDTIEMKKCELKSEFDLAMEKLKLQLNDELEKLDREIEELRNNKI